MMTEILGMHWTLALSILACTILVLDFFIFQGDVMTFIADFFFVPVILHFIPVENLLWKILLGVIVYGMILAFHWCVYRKVIKKLINLIAPQKIKNSNELLLGKTGRLRWIEEQTFIAIGDECLPCSVESDLSGEELVDKKAEVIAWKDNSILQVKLLD